VRILKIQALTTTTALQLKDFKDIEFLFGLLSNLVTLNLYKSFMLRYLEVRIYSFMVVSN